MDHPVPPRLNVARLTEDRPKANNRLLIQERRRQAMRLRVAGLSTGAIALRLAADPAVNSTGEAFPGGYGANNYHQRKPPPSHDQLRRECAADIALVYERRKNSADRDSDFMFDMAIDRIEASIAAIWSRVGNGSQLHVGRLVELLELQGKMMGWLRSPVNVTVDQSVHISAESPQPNWDHDYLAKFYSAMVEAGAEDPAVLEAAGAAIAELPAASADTVAAVTIQAEATEPR